MSDEVQIQMANKDMMPPQNRTVLVRKEFLYTNKPPYDRSALVFGPARTLPIWTPGWVEIDTIFVNQAKALWNGKAHLAEVLDVLTSRISQIVRDNSAK